MRNGDISVEVDSDEVMLVFSGGGAQGHYASYYLNPGEAKILGQLLMKGAEDAGGRLIVTSVCEAMNQLHPQERQTLQGDTKEQDT